MSIMSRFRQQPKIIKELIGRVQLARPVWKRPVKSLDETRPDFEFYDKLRHCLAKGYELAGLFVQPTTETYAGAVLPTMPIAKLVPDEDTEQNDEDVERTNRLINRMLTHYHPLFLDVARDLYALGDQYIIISPDGTLVAISPDQVEVVADGREPHKAAKIIITTQTEEATFIDTYEPFIRTLEIKLKGANVVPDDDLFFVFPNLIGVLPVVHFANNRTTNEVYGSPVAAPLLPLLDLYDNLLMKMTDGGQLMGNPIPVIEGVKDVQETINLNKTEEDEEYLDVDGNTETRERIRFDLLSMLLLGDGGSFKFASPSVGFTSDVRAILKSLFLLILDFTHIPEFIWGGALGGSRASAETQMPPFTRFIDFLRTRFAGIGADTELGLDAQGGLLEVINIWLRWRRLTDARTVVAGVALHSVDIDLKDKNVHLQTLMWASGSGKLTDARALELTKLVHDPDDEVERAHEEADERAPELDANANGDFRRGMRGAANQGVVMDENGNAN